VRVIDLIDAPGAPAPGAVVVDRHGTLWFNDDGAATVTALERNGTMTTQLIGEAEAPLPSATPDAAGRTRPRFRRLRAGIRLAIGPDGEAWFARTRPTPQIGRLRGGARFDVPDAFGPVTRIAGTRDGFWLVSASGIDHLDVSGHFNAVPVAEGTFERNAGGTALTVDDDGSLLVAARNTILRFDAHGLRGRYALPDATLDVRALTTGCDGAVYAALSSPQVARFGRDGSIMQFPLAVYEFDGLVRDDGCRLWVTADSNTPQQRVGILQLVPASRR
jgi:streptogramin lyase